MLNIFNEDIFSNVIEYSLLIQMDSSELTNLTFFCLYFYFWPNILFRKCEQIIFSFTQLKT